MRTPSRSNDPPAPGTEQPAPCAGHIAGATLERASQLLSDGRLEEARALFQRVLERDPVFGDAYLGRGRCHMGLGDRERALADLERAAALTPDDPAAWYHRALLARETSDYDGALHALARANEIRPEARTWHAIGEIHTELGADFDAIEAYGRSFELDHTSVPSLVARARLFMAHECFVAALADYSTCVLLEPREPRHLISRGNAHYELADRKRAIADYEAALGLDPEQPEVFLNLGCIALDSDRIPRAIQHLTMAIEMAPEYQRAYLNRGLAHYYQDRDTSAERDLQRAVELDGADADASFALARLYARQCRYQAATELLERALERCPGYVDELVFSDTFRDVRKLSRVKHLIETARDRLC